MTQKLSPMDPESMGNKNVAIEDMGNGYVIRTSTNKAGRLSYSLYFNGDMQMAGGLDTIKAVIALMQTGMSCHDANMHIHRTSHKGERQ